MASSPTFDACALMYKDNVFINLKRSDNEEDAQIWLHPTQCRGAYCNLIGSRPKTALDCVHILYTELNDAEIASRLRPYVKKVKEMAHKDDRKRFDVNFGIMPSKSMNTDEIQFLKANTTRLGVWLAELKSKWFRDPESHFHLHVYEAGFDAEIQDQVDDKVGTTKLCFHKDTYKPTPSPLFCVEGSSQGYIHAYDCVLKCPTEVSRGISVMSDRVRVSVSTGLGTGSLISMPLKRINTTADIAALTASSAQARVTRTTIACAQNILNEMISDQETRLCARTAFVPTAVLHRIASRVTELASTAKCSEAESTPVAEVLNVVNGLIVSDWQDEDTNHDSYNGKEQRGERFEAALDTVEQMLAEIHVPATTYTQRVLGTMWKRHKRKLEELMKRSTARLTGSDIPPTIAQDSVPKRLGRRTMLPFGDESDRSE